MATRQTKSRKIKSGLSVYKAKRSFDKTPEPAGKKGQSKNGHLFVIQKHRATALHYDFRLEADGVLKSWAVPKGPSLNPKDKRLAMAVEDHPVDYAEFEGIIPEGEYGGGTVMVWDYGSYIPDPATPNVSKAIKNGELKFTLKGEKLGGSWALVHTHERQWLLIKHRDEFATEDSIADEEPRSVFTGRTLAEIAKDEGGNVEKAATGDPASVEKSKRGKRQPASAPRSRARRSKTKKTESTEDDVEMPAAAIPAPMPKAVHPMLATLVDEPFSSDEWVFETKWDGVRTICFLKDGKHRFVSRRQNDVTSKYPEVGHIGNVLTADNAILDGEIVALDREGIPRFQLLQPRFGLKLTREQTVSDEEYTIVYYLFDLIYLNGYDLSNVDLRTRKELLRSIIGSDEFIRYSEHIEEDGKKFFEQIEKVQLEGMIAKRADSLYVQKRTRDWLKVKTLQRSEVVIAGYTEPRRSRNHFGALVMGLYDGNKLKYIGHTGGGFNQKTLKQVFDLMQPLRTDRNPFSTSIKTNEAVQWIEPKLVAEVKFSEWTGDGHMRQPIYLGLRDDKDPKECRLEKKSHTKAIIKEEPSSKQKTTVRSQTKSSKIAAATILLSNNLKGNLTVKTTGGVVSLTHLDKVLWPRDKYAKRDLLKYYYQIAQYLLPYVKERPLILKRYPNGIDEQPFHQHTIQSPPDFVDTHVRDKNDDDDVVYAVCNNVASILYVANLGSISFHPWSARRQTPQKPDWILFDLDPGQASFGQVLEVALILREQLSRIGLDCYPKTSGSKGVHVYVPVKNVYAHDQIVQFATLIAHLAAAAHPDLIEIERMTSKRKKGRVYLDHLQNGFGKSLAAPYSVRARDHAPVSTPLTWEEVKKGKFKNQDFTIKNLLKRVEKVGDLFKGALTQKQSLNQALSKIEKELSSKNNP